MVCFFASRILESDSHSLIYSGKPRVTQSLAVAFVFCHDRPRHVMATVEAIVQEASAVPVYLPNVSALKESLRKAREWSDKVDQVQVGPRSGAGMREGRGGEGRVARVEVV